MNNCLEQYETDKSIPKTISGENFTGVINQNEHKKRSEKLWVVK